MMTRKDFYQRIMDHPVILDGATGTNLQEAGMPAGVCPELWILDHPEVIVRLQKAYVDAGTEILYAPTFSGNRIKLAEYGIADRAEEINRRLAALSKEAAGDRALVAGDLTMTGLLPVPMGPMKPEELIDVYREQAGYLLDAGVDLFVVETMMSLAETRAALIAIRELCDLPVITSLTYGEDGRTLCGTDPVTATVVLQSLGADVIGINCSTGPAQMLPLISRMREYADVPLLVKPNAGLPVLKEGRTIYPMEPEEFASFGPAFVEAGAGLLGGCCGSRPDHIIKLAEAVRGMKVLPPDNHHPRVLASERSVQEIRPDGPFLVIGERINPTGKKALQKELREGRLDLVEEYALSQEEMGAHFLDVNLGVSGIDEKEMMLQAIDRIGTVSSLPLCIDSSRVEVIEAALRHYPGRALINSISLEKGKAESLLPLAKKYGAMFILLPLSGTGLPKDFCEKKRIIEELLDQAGRYGIDRKNIIVDGLVTTAGANPDAGRQVLEVIRWCGKELGLATTVGLSNISFGLPERAYVNAAFAAMAIREGLTMAIANPSDHLLMGAAFAADMLENKKESDLRYIHLADRIREGRDKEEAGRRNRKPDQDTFKSDHNHGPEEGKDPENRKDDPVFQAVLKGKKNSIEDCLAKALSRGISPGDLLEEYLIPAISEVGDLFDRQKYFLPQLIAGASAMEKAVKYLEPMMASSDRGREAVPVVIATVEGDIHDIGKNLVALMLRNFGYRVRDLGKDVPAREIIRAAKEEDARIILLSALMTTTMMRMRDVVDLKNKELPETYVMIGGAVTTPEFAEEIGADAWSSDAADAVRVAGRLLETGL